MEAIDIQRPMTPTVDDPTEESELSAEDAAGIPREPYSASTAARTDEDNLDVDTRLIPPPMPERRLRIRVRSVGREAPRIAFDPEQE